MRLNTKHRLTIKVIFFSFSLSECFIVQWLVQFITGYVLIKISNFLVLLNKRFTCKSTTAVKTWETECWQILWAGVASCEPLRLSFLFKNCGLWTFSCDFAHTINEKWKWLTQLPTLLQSFCWWQCSEVLDVKIPDPPISPSLINLHGFCGRFLTAKKEQAWTNGNI